MIYKALLSDQLSHHASPHSDLTTLAFLFVVNKVLLKHITLIHLCTAYDCFLLPQQSRVVVTEPIKLKLYTIWPPEEKKFAGPCFTEMVVGTFH